MDANEIMVLLNRLANMRQEQAAIKSHFDSLRDKILTPEIRAALAEIDAEEQTTQEAVNAGVEQLTADVKQAVIGVGATVKAAGITAVYSAGRVTWDTKALDGFAAGHPEILPFRKVGEPSVSIREVAK